MKQRFITIPILLLATFLQSCILVSRDKDIHPPTIGKELLDLGEARAKNLITQSEYESLKQSKLSEANNGADRS